MANPKLTAKKLAKITQKTPYLLMDLDSVADKYQEMHKSLPDFKIFYAVKCNPEERILKRLHKEGSLFEVASVGEIKRLIKIGFNLDGCIYSNPVKPTEHIAEAYKLGVRYFAYDCPEELEKIAKAAPGSKVYLRMTVSNHGSLINLANKFGADKSHAVMLLLLAQDLGLEAFGLAFHIGSQSENVRLWDQAFDDVVDVLNELKEQKVTLKCLNIGGGFPARYTEKVPTMGEISRRINKNLKKLPYKMELWCEPGRFMVAEAGVIATTVIGKTNRQNKPWIYVDAGRFQAFVEMFESDSLQYPIYTSADNAPRSKPKSLYTVTGPSCDSYDTISRDVSLPTVLQVGDQVYFGTAGGYTNVYGAPFNDFPVPAIIYTEDFKETK